jgi:hypothetical protein
MPEEKRPAESTPTSASPPVPDEHAAPPHPSPPNLEPTFGYNQPSGGPSVSRNTPLVQRVQSVSDSFHGPPKVGSDSSLPFETGTELSGGLQRRPVNDAALLSTTGEFAPPQPLDPASLAVGNPSLGEPTLRPGAGHDRSDTV